MHLHPDVHKSGYVFAGVFSVYLFAYAWLTLHADCDSTHVLVSAATGSEKIVFPENKINKRRLKTGITAPFRTGTVCIFPLHLRFHLIVLFLQGSKIFSNRLIFLGRKTPVQLGSVIFFISVCVLLYSIIHLTT